ncbi:hypothetical protein FHR81_002305 [Actinoalloteichus hoggarensis]|uniref:Uncharacterized protein n=1 Tax=Actinoalloteichus hoggarensis TaxID=1470176 RepID=A0A221W6H6_9PSEU|nr:hypothetical protein AHOG_18545 [Actinoalloteichus hoggarensis]MBB5921267.1 hypothetical protein [Actinoalloteichus hoggarensis]
MLVFRRRAVRNTPTTAGGEGLPACCPPRGEPPRMWGSPGVTEFLGARRRCTPTDGVRRTRSVLRRARQPGAPPLSWGDGAAFASRCPTEVRPPHRCEESRRRRRTRPPRSSASSLAEEASAMFGPPCTTGRRPGDASAGAGRTSGSDPVIGARGRRGGTRPPGTAPPACPPARGAFRRPSRPRCGVAARHGVRPIGVASRTTLLRRRRGRQDRAGIAAAARQVPEYGGRTGRPVCGGAAGPGRRTRGRRRGPEVSTTNGDRR